VYLQGAEPFLLPGGRHGVLLIHGFTGLPAELRLLGEYLNVRGFTVLAIRLAGHGTTVEDLSRMEHEDWMDSVRDGYAIHTAVELGYPVAIITGGSTESVADRFRKLGVKDVYLACRDKVTALEEFCLVRGLKPEQVLYMGDDLPDYGVMQRVGVPTCPADASPEIRELAVYVSDRPGGDGCVRDVIEQVLRLHGKWTACPGALQ